MDGTIRKDIYHDLVALPHLNFVPVAHLGSLYPQKSIDGRDKTWNGV